MGDTDVCRRVLIVQQAHGLGASTAAGGTPPPGEIERTAR
jgi:hypothetical protein